ncbi:hypothetical protein D3C78_1692590 [compost metagenome]
MLGVADDHRGFVQGRVIRVHHGGQIGLAKVEADAIHRGMTAGFEDVQWFHGCALRGGDAHSLGQWMTQDF